MGMSRKKDCLIFIVLFVVTILIVFYALYLLKNSFVDGEETVLSYSEKSSLEYKVYLKENSFYSSEYVGEDYDVIASSIDKIVVDFNYLLNTSNYVSGKSYYTINSKIVAYQKADERKIWDDEKIIKDKTITLYDEETTNISSSDSFTIDYQDYKDRMDSYKKNYSVALTGNLIVEIEIKNDLIYDKFKDDIDLASRKMTLTIPLTEQIVSITKDGIDDESNQLIEKANSTINYLKLSLSGFAFLGGIGLSVFLGIILVKLFGYDSKYVRELKKILRTYNSIIVNVKKINISDNQNVMVVNSFDELLDAESELRAPILHSVIKNNSDNLFAIKYDNDLLIYEMKSNLYEQDKKRKQNKRVNCNEKEL